MVGTGIVVLAEVDVDVVVVAGDLADGDGGDAGNVLSEEQDQAACDPVGDLDAVIVQQPGHQVPALAVADRGSGAPRRAGDGERLAVPVAGGPGQEVADVGSAGAGGEPVVDVGLAAGGQGGAACAEPAEEPTAALIMFRARAV